MKTTQIYEFLNDVYGEVTGSTGIVAEDLSNIIDVGQTLLSTDYREKYVNAMLNRIGRMVFVDRPYTGMAPRIQRDAWEWGSIMSKSRVKDFEAVENPTWNLTKGDTPEQFQFQPPTVQTTLYNQLITWEIDCSFVNRQLRQSFVNAAEMDRFLSMIRTQIDNSVTQQIDNLSMRAINAFIARRINDNVAVVDLLAGYNAAFGQSLTAAAAITNADFNRYAAYQILLYRDRIRAKTAAFSINDDGYTTFTPREYLHLVLHSDLAKALDVYLQSDVYHDAFTDVGIYDTVPYWQGIGSGGAFALADTSHINITVPGVSPAATVNRNYIVGVMFDRDAIGIINEDRRVEVAYNARGEFWNNFYKTDTRLYNDPAENGIVFTIGTGVINE